MLRANFTLLLLFLQPTIVRDDAAANRVSRRKYDQMRSLSLRIDQFGNIEREPRSVFPRDGREVLSNGLRFGPDALLNEQQRREALEAGQ